MPTVKFELVIKGGGKPILHRTLHSERDVEKLASEILDYKVPIVPDTLYQYFKGQYSKEELGRIVNKMILEITSDILRLKKVVKALKKTERKYSELNVKRSAEVTYTYYLAAGVVLNFIVLFGRLGVMGREAIIRSSGFTVDELTEIERAFGKSIVTVKDNKVALYNVYSHEPGDEEMSYSTYLTGDYILE